MKKKAIIIDLDGTLCDSSHRQHFMQKKPKDWEGFYGGIQYDSPNERVVDIITFYLGLDYEIIFVSGRPEKYRDITIAWLDIHLNYCNYENFCLDMRTDGDFRPDDIVKKEIYDEFIEPYYDVKLVLDDRDRVVKMWRSLGLQCWQVAEGDF